MHFMKELKRGSTAISGELRLNTLTIIYGGGMSLRTSISLMQFHCSELQLEGTHS